MADSFPTALQRTSDERWLTLEVVTRERGRLVARVKEEPRQAAVVRWNADHDYEAHVRTLLDTPPPTGGPGVHIAWPVDLLHDLDVRIVGYTSARASVGTSFPLAHYLDPARRATIAPLATRRHHLRVARNTATAIAALHHVGHGRIRGRNLRLDDRARIVVVRTDELVPGTTPTMRAEDERRLGNLVARLVGGRPWAGDPELIALLERAADRTRPPAPASEWFHVLRSVEKGLPGEPAAAPAAQETRVVRSTDLATALATARAAAGLPEAPAAEAPRRPIVIDSNPFAARARRTPALDPAPAPARITRAAPHPTTTTVAARTTATVAEPAAAGPAAPAPAIPEIAPVPAAAAAAATPSTRPATRVGRPAGGGEGSTARAAFAVASGLLIGGLASVVPFLMFLLGSAAGLSRMVSDGRMRSERPGVLGRLASTLPFATGGVAFAAFILFDLLLLLGLVMAVAQRVFEYGPGFTLTWVLDLPEVPVLVRWFAFAVGGATGLSLGGPAHDRLRARAGERRMIATPAIALALAIGLVVVDAGVVWWPLPTVG